MSLIRQFWIGLIAIPLSIAVAVVLTAVFGPIFGAWDWKATSFILLSAVTLVLLTLDGSGHINVGPASRIAPGMTHIAAPEDLDSMTSAHLASVQMYQNTSASPSHQSRWQVTASGWIRQALVTGLAAFVFLIVLLI